MTNTSALPITLPMSAVDIHRYLPQRYPMLLVDRVIAVTPGESLTAVKNVSVNESFFEGHFPGNPIMPGVLLIEAMAQACGILGFLSAGRTPADGSVYLLASVEKARFRRLVVPGDQLHMQVRIISSHRNIHRFACQALVDGQVATDVTLLIAEQTATGKA